MKWSMLTSVILSWIDTIITLVVVLCGGVELNPLCINFPIFITIKFITSIGLLGIFIYICIDKEWKSKLIWCVTIVFNTVYSIALIWNIISIVRYLIYIN